MQLTGSNYAKEEKQYLGNTRVHSTNNTIHKQTETSSMRRKCLLWQTYVSLRQPLIYNKGKGIQTINIYTKLLTYKC